MNCVFCSIEGMKLMIMKQWYDVILITFSLYNFYLDFTMTLKKWYIIVWFLLEQYSNLENWSVIVVSNATFLESV